MRPLNIGVEKALQKIKHYCGYQERCHAEVKDKLYSFGLYKDEVETMLSQLIEEDYLNEERYSIAFAGGHFRMKQWGKVKIKHAMQQHKISTYCINKALAAIADTDYENTLHKLAEAKQASLKGERNDFIKKTKIRNYLMQKGYEPALITKWFNKE